MDPGLFLFVFLRLGVVSPTPSNPARNGPPSTRHDPFPNLTETGTRCPNKKRGWLNGSRIEAAMCPALTAVWLRSRGEETNGRSAVLDEGKRGLTGLVKGSNEIQRTPQTLICGIASSLFCAACCRRAIIADRVHSHDPKTKPTENAEWW
eukprot:jgi/Psemu1/54371/gm1.54371_g